VRVVALLGIMSAGCALQRPRLDEAMRTEIGSGERNVGVPQQYRVHCPDVLEVSLPGRTEEPALCTVALDGRLDLASAEFPRVEGQTVEQIGQAICEQRGVPLGTVSVRVAEYRSQHVYVGGPGIGVQRAVPYRGPETVVDFLQRVGGVAAGAAAGDVHVIRDGVVDNRPPQVYHVDLKAVLLDQDQRTNIRLRPFDQVYVGETRASFVEHCIPRWVRPLYDKLCGLPRTRVIKPSTPPAPAAE
jgi:protein involved in polysaccharide export with SLBB domain